MTEVAVIEIGLHIPGMQVLLKQIVIVIRIDHDMKDMNAMNDMTAMEDMTIMIDTIEMNTRVTVTAVIAPDTIARVVQSARSIVSTIE